MLLSHLTISWGRYYYFPHYWWRNQTPERLSNFRSITQPVKGAAVSSPGFEVKEVLGGRILTCHRIYRHRFASQFVDLCWLDALALLARWVLVTDTVLVPFTPSVSRTHSSVAFTKLTQPLPGSQAESWSSLCLAWHRSSWWPDSGVSVEATELADVASLLNIFLDSAKEERGLWPTSSTLKISFPNC